MVSGFSNLAAGAAQLYGAASGNVAGSTKFANVASSLGSFSGLATFATTGNAGYGAVASNVEGIALTGGANMVAAFGKLPSTAQLVTGIADSANSFSSLTTTVGLTGCHF